MTTRTLSQVLVWAVLGASLAAGCGSVSPLSTDGAAGQGGTTGAAGQGGTTGSAGQGGTTGSAGQGGAGGTGHVCSGLTQTQCAATPGCAVGTCPNCKGGTFFAGCYDPTNDGVACDTGCPVSSCSELNEAACVARTDCRADYCPTCTGKSFSRCTTTNDSPGLCAQPHCVQACSTVTTLDACEARPDCHSVFQDAGTCDCAASGCCAKFSFCADGGKAACTGTPLCRSVAPFCESPYVVSYTGTCYEGCVKKTDCAP